MPSELKAGNSIKQHLYQSLSRKKKMGEENKKTFAKININPKPRPCN